jgi:Neprosin
MRILQRAASPFLAATVAIAAGTLAASATSVPTPSDAVVERSTAPGTSSVGSDPKPLPPHLRAAAQRDRHCQGTRPHSVCRRYAGLYRSFASGRRPVGVGATLSVHNPRDIRRGEHSLAEISIHMPGAYGNIIEVGWRRYLGRTSLFVFRWNHNDPSCYNRCGFVKRGPGKKPGVRLRPGRNLRVEWRHHHRRWNLYVNGRRSGFYPDRLWRGRFHHVGVTQLFGEVTFRRNGAGRCIDMGNGRFPRRDSARVYRIRFVGTSASYRGGRRQVTAPEYYGFNRTSPRSFKYGGRGPC